MLSNIIISAVVTAIIIFLIKSIYKKYNTSATPMGCLLGWGIMFYLVFSCVSGISNREKNKFITQVTLVSSGKTIGVDDSTFTGSDRIYVKKKNLYLNDTGRDLVKYSIKYTKDGSGSEQKPIGSLIKPNKYFYWYDEDDDYYMFQNPPSSTTVIYRSSYGKSHKLDFTYLHFLDYADNVEGSVVFY